jgi:hypothetical protein
MQRPLLSHQFVRHFSADERFAPKLERKNGFVILEICFDWCSIYGAEHVANETTLWELALLDQFHFNDVHALENFRTETEELVDSVLKSHARGHRVHPT